MSFPATEILTGGPYTETARFISIRNLAFNIKTDTLPDTELKITTLRKDSKVFKLTKKIDWLSTDQDFPQVINASNCFTAVEILRGIATPQALSEADAVEKKAYETIKEINGQSDIIPDGVTTTTDGIGGEMQGTFN